MIEVYYAEDDETIGKSVKEYLEQQNCKVAVFDRIADVKKALIGHLPTIVLLDWNDFAKHGRCGCDCGDSGFGLYTGTTGFERRI